MLYAPIRRSAAGFVLGAPSDPNTNPQSYPHQDGSSRGNPGPAGMGGVLRDSKGKILCLYSEYVGIADSNAA